MFTNMRPKNNLPMIINFKASALQCITNPSVTSGFIISDTSFRPA